MFGVSQIIIHRIEEIVEDRRGHHGLRFPDRCTQQVQLLMSEDEGDDLISEPSIGVGDVKFHAAAHWAM